MQTVAVILLILVYGGLAAYVWHFWRNRSDENYPLRREWPVLAGALLLHTCVLWYPVVQSGTLLFGFSFALNLVSWLMVLLYWAGLPFYPLKGLQILLFPLTVLSLLTVLLFPGIPVRLPMTAGFLLHVGASLLAYCFFGIAALFAVLIVLLERDLRRRVMSPLMHFLPPLLSIEKLMFQGIWLGFALLTLSLVSGFFFSEALLGIPFSWSHKAVFGLLSWIIYAILVWGRVAHSWRGRKAAVWVIAGFLSLMLAYIGSKFVLEILLGRAA